jgi:hypothetical protein
MHHFVAWKRHGMGGEAGDLLQRAPASFYTRQNKIFQEAEPGDVLWLLTSMKYKGHIVAPALMGRLKIGNIRRQGRQYRQAILLPDDAGSVYFPMNNSFDLLKELRFTGKASVFDPDHCTHCQNLKHKGNPYSSIGLHFMSSRMLTAEGHERMESYMQEVLSKKPIFISYRWSDNPLFALSLVEALIERGIVVWWDQWMVSTLTFRQQGAPIPPQLLQEALDDGIRQSSLFVALVTNTYTKSTWTLEEFNLAIRHKPETHIIAVDMGGSLPYTNKRLHHEQAPEPEALAQRIANLSAALPL